MSEPATPASEPASDDVLDMYTVYANPLDYPGCYVVRRWIIIGDNRFWPEAEPCAVAATLDEARKAIPRDRVNMGREKDDDPAIYEVWV